MKKKKKEKKKTKIILIIIVLILLLLFALFIGKEIRRKNTSNPIKEPIINDKDKKDKTTTEKETKLEDHRNKETEKPVEDQKEEINSKTSNSNTEEDLTPSNEPYTSPEPVTIYSCPDGFSLNGTNCISVVPANYDCPEGMIEQNSPEYNNRCIDLNSGYEVEDNNTCPEGFMPFDVIVLWDRTIHKCIPLYDKIYTCSSDYTLNGDTCTKIVPATINQ